MADIARLIEELEDLGDVTAPPEAVDWSEAAVRQFFASGGTVLPEKQTSTEPPLCVVFARSGAAANSMSVFGRQLSDRGCKVLLVEHMRGYDMTSWPAYIDHVVGLVERARDGRDVVVVGYSFGSLAAYFVAARVGAKKAFVVGRRAPTVPFDSVFGCSSAGGLPDGTALAKCMNTAWPSPYFAALIDKVDSGSAGASERALMSKLVADCRHDYLHAPGLSAEIGGTEYPTLRCPVLCVVAEEAEAGETRERMRGWAEHTSERCEFVEVPAKHLDCFSKGSPVPELLLRDICA
eukprot:TRINITY_DN36354_c0_g1_i1.p1 TRINITY_DN36354_c0_g1~~TRINITY_DN36354_c0_g1_i1.p1  ORF type:complete len:293 (+),score=83.36 TRINITY_DN36354_c0_g1_i1:57-935(+)